MTWNLLTARRDDLPEMRWPLVLLTAFAACLSGGLGCTFRGGAMVLTLPFVVLAVVAYASLILLWRRLAALAVTPGIAAGVLLCGGNWLTAVCAAVCILAVAYVYASLFLAKERRFVRIASTASAVGICVVLLAVAWVSWRFASLGDAIRYVCDAARSTVNDGFAALADVSGGVRYVLLPETVDSVLYQAVAALPAIAGMGCILFAGLCDGGIRFLFWLLDCDEYFTPETDEGITIPKSFSILYTLLLFLVISTDAASNPPLYHVLSNCHWIFALPCAWVGVTVGFRKVRHAMDTASFYGRPRNHSPLPSLFVFVFFFLFLGVSMAFTLMAILGAAFILMQKKDAEPSEDEHL